MKINRNLTQLTVLLGAALGSTALAASGPKSINPTTQERQSYIQTAQVWQNSDIANKNILVGPEGSEAIPLGATLNCRFVEPQDEEVDGQTPKFYCDTANGERFKVKYGLKNGEIYSEVAASRLLWALGFGADTMYSVRVVCENCPKEPWYYLNNYNKGLSKIEKEKLDEAKKRGTRIFIPAVVERKFKGIKIEQEKDQGWGWHEIMNFTQVDEELQVQREAFALLMSMLEHADSKNDNQRLVCLKSGVVPLENGRYLCAKPFAIAQDLGWNFGPGWDAMTPTKVSKMDLGGWEATSVWADPGKCITNTRGIPKIFTGTFKPFRVREASRAFLSGLLNQLSREQIRNIFVAARMDLRAAVLESEREATVDRWADALQAKIEEIDSVRCPE